jgi:adenosylcobinamide-GDP ribazoletransferase
VIASARSALAFLTVLPVGDPGADRLGRALFPAVGALLGLLAWAALWLGSLLGGPWLGAVAALVALAVATGGLHLDGFADSADGLLAIAGRERRLEIMRDPRLGSFGVAALVLLLLADAAVLQRLGSAAALAALVAGGALSRLAMLAVAVLVPYARPAGTGLAAAGGDRRDLAVGALLAAVALAPDWRHGALAAAAAGAAGLGVAWLAWRRIGGATGDVYGAVAELALLAALLAFEVPL